MSFCTPSEKEKYAKAKCTVIVRLFDFLSSLFTARYAREAARLQQLQLLLVTPKATNHYATNIYKLFMLMCLDPCSLGFDLNEVNPPLKIFLEFIFTLFLSKSSDVIFSLILD